MSEPQVDQRGATVQGEVVAVDYDRDEILVRLDAGDERKFAFELFDASDVYQTGQRFRLNFDEQGALYDVTLADAPQKAHKTVSGYVESVDQDDELVWVYLRGDEGWQRKVMPLELFHEAGLDRPGRHFLLDLDDQDTPMALHDDEQELEMQPLLQEETKPRWTNRPAAEAEPE